MNINTLNAEHYRKYVARFFGRFDSRKSQHPEQSEPNHETLEELLNKWTLQIDSILTQLQDSTNAEEDPIFIQMLSVQRSLFNNATTVDKRESIYLFAFLAWSGLIKLMIEKGADISLIDQGMGILREMLEKDEALIEHRSDVMFLEGKRDALLPEA